VPDPDDPPPELGAVVVVVEGVFPPEPDTTHAHTSPLGADTIPASYQ